MVLPHSLTCCKKLTASRISKESSLIFVDGNTSTAHKTCMRLPSNKTPNSFFHRKLTKPPATQTTLYSLPLLLCNFFNREIHNGGSRAARIHGISQRQIQELSYHTHQVTRVTKGNRQGLVIHGCN